MLSRLFSFGVALGLSSAMSLVLAPVSVAEAANPGWGAYASQGKRPVFRPWRRLQAQPQVSHRWRPQGRVNTPHAVTAPDRARALNYPDDRWGRSKPLLLPSRPAPVEPWSRPSGNRTAARFRPDARDPVTTAHRAANSGYAASTGRSGAADANFRPTRSAARPSYEQMQAKAAMRPAGGYPSQMVAAPAYAYRGYWPTW